MSHIYIESYGVRLDIEVQAAELESSVRAILPPGWTETDEFPEDGHLTVSGAGDGTFGAYAEGVEGTRPRI